MISMGNRARPSKIKGKYHACFLKLQKLCKSSRKKGRAAIRAICKISATSEDK